MGQSSVSERILSAALSFRDRGYSLEDVLGRCHGHVKYGTVKWYITRCLTWNLPTGVPLVRRIGSIGIYTPRCGVYANSPSWLSSINPIQVGLDRIREENRDYYRRRTKRLVAVPRTKGGDNVMEPKVRIAVIKVVLDIKGVFTGAELGKCFPKGSSVCTATLRLLLKCRLVEHVGTLPGRRFVGRNGNILMTNVTHQYQAKREWREGKLGDPIAVALERSKKITAMQYTTRKALALLNSTKRKLKPDNSILPAGLTALRPVLPAAPEGAMEAAQKDKEWLDSYEAAMQERQQLDLQELLRDNARRRKLLGLTTL